MKATNPPSAVLCGMTLLALAACSNGVDLGVPDPGGVGNGGTGGLSIVWGPRLEGSDLSPVLGAEDDFGADVADAVFAAARIAPNGTTQSSRVENGRTADEMSVHLVRDDDDNLVYEVTDRAQIVVRVPSGLPRQRGDLALYTDLIPGIEPDLSSYPHEVLGIWAWNGEVWVFWDKNPSLPPVAFGAASPTGSATYEGDAVGLHAAGGGATKFLADVRLVADFDGLTVGGEVDGFRSLAGKSLGGLSVTLGETAFSAQGDPFSGDTASGGTAGGGKWGRALVRRHRLEDGRDVRLRRRRPERRGPRRVLRTLGRIGRERQSRRSRGDGSMRKPGPAAVRGGGARTSRNAAKRCARACRRRRRNLRCG